VSIGVPVYNGEKYLREAINSILAQTFTDYELIICDNCSTDSTEQICREFATRDERVRYYRRDANRGAAANFNWCVELARAPYFRWHAHDDFVSPTHLEKCVQVLDTRPDVVLVYPRRQYVLPDRTPIDDAVFWNDGNANTSFHDPTFRRLLRTHGSYYVFIQFGLVRIEALRRTALMRSYCSADLVLVPELHMLGKFHEVPERLFFQRAHENNAEWAFRRTKRGEAIFMDPSNAHRFLMPSLTIFLGLLVAILQAPVRLRDKVARLTDLAAYQCSKLRRFANPFHFIARLVQEWRWSRRGKSRARDPNHGTRATHV